MAALHLSTGGDLSDTVREVRPTILIGTTATGGTFTEPAIRAIAETCPQPVIFPLSNPTLAAEATPAQVLEWTDGRALVATGSPFAPVQAAGRTHVIGQANNAFVFPGLGLAAIVAGAHRIDDAHFLVAARTLASLVSDARLADRALYPAVADLRCVSREIAVACVRAFGTIDGRPIPADGGEDLAREAVDAATWWPDYPPYEPA